MEDIAGDLLFEICYRSIRLACSLKCVCSYFNETICISAIASTVLQRTWKRAVAMRRKPFVRGSKILIRGLHFRNAWIKGIIRDSYMEGCLVEFPCDASSQVPVMGLHIGGGPAFDEYIEVKNLTIQDEWYINQR